MQSFRDTKGRLWNLDPDPVVAKRVRAMTGVDLYHLDRRGKVQLAELMDDMILLVDVLFAICQDQAAALKVSDEDFGRGFDAEVLIAASEAFMECLVDFSSAPKARQKAREGLAKTRKAAEIVTGRQLVKMEAELDAKTVEQMADEMEARIEASRKSTPNGTPGNAPPSSASTPEGGPTGS